jgi:mono/diheme cytochrome c family protein
MHRLTPASLTLALCLTVPPLSAAEPAADAIAKPSTAKPSAEGVAFFEKEVRPLLVKHCSECHSADAKEIKGNLSLDTRGGWQAGGDSGPSIVPGQPDESLLIEALRYESYEMPPAGKLSDAEIAVFVRWVEMGAPDPRDGQPVARTEKPSLDLEAAREYWAFQLPESHRPPQVKNTNWPTDDLDRFILANLEAAGLSPAPPADRPTWLRRVTFDLTGLPPTSAELTAFLADDSPEAYATVVDRLLASKQFGVHWGRHWLDVARYADSNGSDFNATFFNAWRYRDYVIDSVNNDRPYDEFVRQQIAGDLLPYSSDAERIENLVASTFVTIGPKMLSERDKEKLTMDVVDEQVDSLGKAFLGLTIGCARCHDHKFDPIPTADYYALAGIFTSTVTLEGESQQYVSAWKETSLPIPAEHAAALEQHKQQKDRLTAALNQAKKDLKTADEQLARLGSSDGGILVDDTEAKKIGQWKESTFSPNFVGKGYVHDEKTGQGTKSITWTPTLPHAGRYEVRISYAGANGRDSAVPVTIRHADGVANLKVDQTQVAAIDKLFKPLGTFRFEAGMGGSVTVSNTGTTGYVLADAVQFLPVDTPTGPAVAQEPTDPKLVAAEKAVAQAKRRMTSGEAALKALDKHAPPPAPTAMAPREAPAVGDCRICVRGEHKNRGQASPRGFLQVISGDQYQVENAEQSGRVELAEWIARPDNPLTARVFVNRVWQKMIGEGLVRTVDNFGHLGERPTHPELLDTLAVDFVADGWSLKRLVRRIALSAA